MSSSDHHADEHFAAQVLTPLHGRCLQHLKRQVGLGRRCNRRRRAALSVCRCLTEPGQIKTGEVACIGEWRRQAGLKLGRRQVQETAGRAFAESGLDSFPAGPSTAVPS